MWYKHRQILGRIKVRDLIFSLKNINLYTSKALNWILIIFYYLILEADFKILMLFLYLINY